MLKEQIQRVREENDGFTLAELLIVVAIILVLVAIAIPVFTGALHNSKASADQANCRAVYADLQANFLTDTDAADGGAWEGAPTATASDTFKLSDGQTVKLATGKVSASFTEKTGWTVSYDDSADNDHDMTWGTAAAPANVAVG